MACLTNADLRDMALYTLNQRKILRRNELLKSAPHIGSHTVTRVWRCTVEYAFRDPIELDAAERKRYECYEGVSDEEWSRAVSEVADTAIMCDWRFDETGCAAINCNPYYPGRGVCRGFHDTTVDPDKQGSAVVGEDREKAFAFVTAHNQRVDTCQPICYDEDRKKKDTYVGVTTLYANKDRTCFVTDPELLAFYLDPLRRVVANGVVEKSAFRVTKEYIGATGTPAVVATIDQAYCRQYGLDYVTERYADENGGTLYQGRCKTDENEGGFFSLSTWVGDTLTKTYNFKRDDFMALVKRTGNARLSSAATQVTAKPKDGTLKKEPPTLPYLADDEKWRSHVDKTKRTLPFPLKLAHLGLGHGITDGLLWTDEYSYLDDGRNDLYGGRLVERPRDISRPLDVRNDSVNNRPDDQSGTPSRSSTIDNVEGDDDGDNRSHEVVNKFIKELAESLNGLKESVTGTSYEVMIDQMLAGYTVDTLGDLSKRIRGVRRSSLLQRALESSLKRMTGKRLSERAVSLVATQAAMKSRIESHVIEVLTAQLKLPFRLLSRGANALSFVQLVGAAVDLFTALVYDPYEKYEHYVSDRVLRAMAHAELVATQRLTGRQRVTLDPFEWMANTRFSNPVEDATYDMLLGMMYTRARRVNSEGSLVYWYRQDTEHGGEDTKVATHAGSTVHRRSVIEEATSFATTSVVVDSAATTTAVSSSFIWFVLAIAFCLVMVSIHACLHLRSLLRARKDVGNRGS